MPLRVYNIGDSDNNILRKLLENQTQLISGSLSLSTRRTPTTVALLPSASPSGQTAFVTDAVATVAAGIGAIVTGGGANFSPVYSDGINWRQF